MDPNIAILNALQHAFLETQRTIHMTKEIASQFQALVYRLEAQIARTETRLTELKAQLEAARKLAIDEIAKQNKTK